MDGEKNEKPMKMDDLGGFPIFFGSTPVNYLREEKSPITEQNATKTKTPLLVLTGVAQMTHSFGKIVKPPALCKSFAKLLGSWYYSWIKNIVFFYV